MPISKSNGAVATAQTSVAETAPAPVASSLGLGKRVLNAPDVQENRKEYKGYDDTKSRRILVQGLTQAVTQSMALAGLGHTTEKDVVASIKSVTRELIKFVEEESK